MFPICNDHGDVVAFSGRMLDPEAKAAKYLNSPETPIFKKSKTFFGLEKTKRPILRAKQAVVCEGQLDLISCHAAGFENLVAPLGTAFTADHARILKRHADEVVLCYDSDAAGKKAAGAAFEHLARLDLPVRAALIPEGHDPDSLVRERGVEAFRALIDGAPGVLRLPHRQPSPPPTTCSRWPAGCVWPPRPQPPSPSSPPRSGKTPPPSSSPPAWRWTPPRSAGWPPRPRRRRTARPSGGSASESAMRRRRRQRPQPADHPGAAPPLRPAHQPHRGRALPPRPHRPGGQGRPLHPRSRAKSWRTAPARRCCAGLRRPPSTPASPSSVAAFLSGLGRDEELFLTGLIQGTGGGPPGDHVPYLLKLEAERVARQLAAVRAEDGRAGPRPGRDRRPPRGLRRAEQRVP